MKKSWPAVVILILSAWGHQVTAGIRPSFSLEDSSWKATEIVVVTEEEKIDGNVRVLEVWKGDLKAGTELSVPELASFAEEEKRTESSLFSPRAKNQNSPMIVTGAKMVLFLKAPAENSDKWQPANLYNEMSVSLVWIEQGETFGYVQVMNPGPSVLIRLRLSEKELQTQVAQIVKTQSALLKTSSLNNLSQRAQTLRKFTSSDHYYARELAFEELAKCGAAALPVLRNMLDDETLLHRHGDVVEALGQAGGTSVGAELTSLVETETKFWKETAPKLKQGWWNGTGVQEAERQTLQNRYSKVLSALYALKKMKYPECKRAVTQFRDFWRSLPQLEDKSGLTQMSEECDNVLQAIAD